MDLLPEDIEQAERRERERRKTARPTSTYWKKAEREEWHWLQDLKREDLEESAPAQLRLSELRRILATVDALERMLRDVTAAFGYMATHNSELHPEQLDEAIRLRDAARELIAEVEK